MISSSVIHLNHCGVSPLHPEAYARITTAANRSAYWPAHGSAPISPLDEMKEYGARLLKTTPASLSFIPNCAHGLNVLAHGLDLKPGDEILSYQYEYPSNHYPWLVQERRGVHLRTFRGSVSGWRPISWSVQDVLSRITARTRVLTISHVQFTSGFAGDMATLGEICRNRDILFVVDAAQSAGALPVYPEQLGIDALVTSGWKWLRGPVGSGLFYTNDRIRSRLTDVWCGPDMMTQGADYLNHTWQPYQDGRRFEYSTLPHLSVVGLGGVLADVAATTTAEQIWSNIQERTIYLREALADMGCSPLWFPEENQSGIVSFTLPDGCDPAQVLAACLEGNLVCSLRGGYLRLAPHCDTPFCALEDALSILKYHLGGRQQVVDFYTYNANPPTLLVSAS